MKLLHTSDWHVGKKIRGHSRADEHRAVFAEMLSVADTESVDLILVAGDLYETAAPTAESELIVNQALLALAEVAPVLAIAGNHDNPRRLAAVEPLMSLGRITMVAEPRAPKAGGTITLTTDEGTPVQAAMLPFVSQRSIVKAGELMSNAGFENAQTYGDRMQRVIAALCADFNADHVNLVLGHAFVHGGSLGGGERPAHLVDEYALSAVDFPATASYVALGHLHRPQQMLGATAIHYCGSPLQLDFGEQDQAKQVNVVSLEPGLPAKVEGVQLNGGRRLRTLTGTMSDLAAIAADTESGPHESDWLRVRVTEPGRAGLAEEVRELLGPGVVDVRVEHQTEVRQTRRAENRSPRELFVDFLAEAGITDSRLDARFAELYEQAGSADTEPEPGAVSSEPGAVSSEPGALL
ncbi:MAG: exonuclease SbcCD subunit D [Acidimicrobiales bacterium]